MAVLYFHKEVADGHFVDEINTGGTLVTHRKIAGIDKNFVKYEFKFSKNARTYHIDGMAKLL